MSLTTTGGQVPALPPAKGPVDLILDAPAPRTRGATALGLAAILLFFGSFAAWSFYAPLSEAAIAPGSIRAEGQRRTIQHLEGGIIRDILVRDGDRVRAGQVLMRLDDVQAASGLETVAAQRLALLAQDARLAAEQSGAPDIGFPAELLVSPDPRAVEVLAGQRALFAARQAALGGQLRVLESRLDQHAAQQASILAQLASARRQYELIVREEADVRRLVAQGLERMPRLLALQRNMAALEGNQADLEAQFGRLEAQSEETQRQMRQLTDQRRQEVSTEQREVRARLNEAEERLRAARDVAVRREIVAPEDGTILHSRFFNPGAVVRGGEPVMELVPAHDRLVAEVQVSPTDIDVVFPGLMAEVRLPAFKQRLVPFLHGHVTFVASDATNDDRRGTSFYRVQITIDDDQLRALQGVELRPGMPVEAMIQIGERSFFRYIAQPVIDSFHRAFREQ
jgi:HlyD family type I secretion membrane fusion protein